MPEGPEVARIAEVIAKGIGKTFVKAEIIENVPGVLHKFTKQGVPGIERLKEPWVFITAASVGKLIMASITTAEEYGQQSRYPGGADTLLCRLGMSGTWAWNKQDHKHARLNLVTENGENLTFLDQRCFGTIEIVSSGQALKEGWAIGHNLLHEPVADQLWMHYKTRMAGKTLGPALLEQDHFSGIGNIYKSEILYRTGIRPDVQIHDLTDDQWRSINHMAHIVLQEAYQAGGSSIREYTADGKEGSYQLQLLAYGQKQCPQGHPITKLKQKQRTTYWCQQCQVLP
jgi:formamidopyrimidine-DNA glycosylase